ncbi:unnamed protein product [Penicillium viridicatum]
MRIPWVRIIVLIWSTKLKPASSASDSRLPSTGKAANPQLFRTAETDKLESAKNGKKRKRSAAVQQDEEDVPDLDFFSSNKRPAASVTETAVATEDDAKVSAQDAVSDDDDSMDEVERRTILNSHKIKVTDMRDLEEIQVQPTSTTDSKKKKKKSKKEDAPTLSKKEQKRARRLFPEPLLNFKELRSKYKISFSGNQLCTPRRWRVIPTICSILSRQLREAQE